jgi:ATP/maltotriose-dependent transcriptional regulator MalT
VVLVSASRADPDALLPLAIAKTAPPQPLPAGVDRRRLFNLLDAAARNPVTLVCAGAGWGKTTLVSAWAETRTAPVAWLSLDKHDNDPQLFWAYVLAALRVAGAVAPDNPLAEIGSVPVDERERGHRLTGGLGHLPEQTVLVLDDFHEVDDPQILREMNDLLRFPPAPLRVVLISRSWPALALHRLRTAGQVAEIRAEDLAFTSDEAAALVRGRGLDLGSQDVSILLNRTEGWATGLHLGAGFLAGEAGSRSLEDFAGDVRVVDDYLTDEVLAGPDLRTEPMSVFGRIYRLASAPRLVPDQALDFPHQIVRARSAFAARDLRRADELLAANPTTLPQTVATVEAGVLGALVADARGQATRAVDQLADAVTLAAREGIRRPFFTLSGSRLDEILHRLQLLGGDAPFVQQAIGETRATRKLPADIATVQGLSERELEVLRYLPTMLTAAEIAADLGVSVNTIKVHMQSIYRKLGVNRRGNAVAQARDNGIL